MQTQVMLKQSAIWLLALSLTACATAPAVQSPLTIATSGSVISAEETAQRYQVNSEWWTAYRDARLSALVEQALANNVD